VTRHLRRRSLARTSALAGAAALILVSLFGASLATGADGPTPVAVPTSTVYIKADKKGLRFVAPKTVGAGEILRVVNQTDPRKIGPHTFSLVTKSSLPKTPKARQLCFTKNHICKAIAAWHGVKGNGPVKKNPAKAGLEGWDTLGSSVTKKGDSWFTGNKKGTSFEQVVSVDISAGPSRIYFLCAIHPWMQGSTEVVSVPTVPTAG
jgi:hypothetical protein